MCWGCAISIRNHILLAGIGAALVATAMAGAQDPAPDPSFSMSVSPSRVRMPATTQIVYRLRMRTGAQAERFSIDAVPPLFQTRLGSGDNVHREGATITPDQRITLEGPGRLTPSGEGTALIACSPSTGLAAHGYEPRYPGYVVELPANVESTLVARYRTGEFALWPGSDLRLTVRVGRGTTGYGAATLDREVEVRSPAVALSGRMAPRVELWTSPQSSPGVFVKLRQLEADSRLSIGGRVMPARAGRRVSLWMIRHGEGEKPARLATVSTDARGRLRFRTRTPERAGSYELWARTPNDAGGRPEHSCSMAFEIPYAG
jgi:hypothetical protein